MPRIPDAGITAPDPAVDLITEQRAHWEATLAANPGMYGPDPSEPGRAAIERFGAEKLTRVLELGAGQGRDTLGFLHAGLTVQALDYASEALAGIVCAAGPRLSSQPATTVHDGERAAAAAVAEAMLTVELQPYPRRVMVVASRPG
ncbi:MAG: hypothetical protein NVSMB60_18920 [Mycobacterium sp.]